MKKKLILGATAVAAVTGLVGAPASAAIDQPVRMQADSFAELLQPIPNATEQLKVADMQAERDAPKLIKAQYGQYDQHHHHHHHSHHSRWWYRSHGYYWFNGAWVLRPRRMHHHHHHHHHNNAPGPY
jgi:hypothetical protein